MKKTPCLKLSKHTQVFVKSRELMFAYLMSLQGEISLDKHLRKKFANKHIFIFVLISLVAIFAFLTACNFGFAGSDFYNSRRRQTYSVEIPLNDSSIQADAPIVSADEDVVQKLFDETEENKDTFFHASDFDNWVFSMTHLDDTNVATYEFSDHGKWSPATNGEVYSNGEIVGSGTNQLKNIKYYRYKSRTNRWKEFSHTNGFDPLAELSDEEKKREDRFLFFRFTADTKGPSIDNSMLCVDTYTKFCFFYSEPGYFKGMFNIPSDWVDYEAPAHPEAGDNGHKKPGGRFYYYDPIGYVEEDGSVVIYDWVKQSIAVNDFRQKRNFTTVAKRSPDSPGCSPYLPADVATKPPKVEHAPGLYIALSSFENIDMGAKKYKGLCGLQKTDEVVDFAYFSLESKIAGENNEGYDPKTLKSEEKFKVAKKSLYRFEQTESSGTLFELEKLGDYKTFKLDTRITHYSHHQNDGLIKINQALDKSASDIIWHGKAALLFEYVSEGGKNKIKFKGFLDENGVRDTKPTDEEHCSVPNDEIFLTSGDEPKEITITYNVPKRGDCPGGKIAVTFLLSFKEE